VSFLWITIPATLLLSAALLALVIHSVLAGELEDPEGPALRLQNDDDRTPELEHSGRADASPPRISGG
jgi:hypothetical protein